MNALNVVLERFDTEYGSRERGGATPTPAEKEKAAAYSEGYAAGQAATKASASNDMEFLTAAAREIESALTQLPSQINAQLCQSLIVVLEKILPALSEKGLAEEVAASVIAAADISKAGSLVINVAPDQSALLAEALGAATKEGVISINEDAALTDRSVTACWNDTTIEFNIDQAVEQTMTALENTLRQLKG